MRRKLFWLFPIVILTTASAAPLCLTGSLASYEALSGGCSVGSVTYSGFNFGSAGSVVLTANQIQVQVVSNGSGDGLSFSGPFTVGAGSSLDALISFMISASALTGQTLTMQNPVVTGGGLAMAVESACQGTFSGGSCSGATQSLDVSATSSGSNTSASITFPSGTTTASITKNIILEGGSAGTSSGASIQSITDINSSNGAGGPGGGPVPEPDTLVMMLGGALVAAALVMRRSRARS